MGLFSKKKKEEEPKRQQTQYDFEEITEITAFNVLRKLAYAEYAGGSLCLKIIPKDKEPRLVIISLSDEKWSKKVRFIAALCYLKYKAGSQSEVAAYICGYEKERAIDLVFECFERV